METEKQPTSQRRRGWSLSSLRIKSRSSVEDEGFDRRGAKRFFSVRTDPRKVDEGTSESGGPGAASPPIARLFRLRPTEKEKGESPVEINGKRFSGAFDPGAVMSSEEEDGDEGKFKRFSNLMTSWRVFGKTPRDRGVKDQVPPSSADSAFQRPLHRESRYASGQFFFEYLVVVSLKKKKDGGYEPQITYQFPKRDGMVKFQREEEEKTLKAITLFCFPEGITWAPLTEYRSETFSFVLTEIDASRRNGYCRRLLPHGNGARPPEAYCIISKLACFGLFSKIFDEVEKRRQISMAMIYPFMQSLREAPFPAPGHTVKIKSFIPESGTEIISLTRPLDSWLEHVDFRTLFRCLSHEEVLQVFAATVLERRIVFIAEELGTLSQVINAVAALLYPFTWQHTFIPIVPEILIDVVMAPTPYLLGVQKRLLEYVTDQTDASDLLVVDLSDGVKKTFVMSIGDEKDILPPKCRDEILQALSARKDDCTLEELNRVVSEAFLPFFIRTVGHFGPYIKRSSSDQRGDFQSRSFYKAIQSKTTRHFVKKFIRTQMFDLFIQDVEEQPANQEGFFQRKVAEYQEKKRKEKTRKH